MTQCGYDSNKMNIRVASSGLTLGAVRPLSNPNAVFSKHRPQYPGPSGGNFCSKDKEKDVSAASFGTLKSQQKMGREIRKRVQNRASLLRKYRHQLHLNSTGCASPAGTRNQRRPTSVLAWRLILTPSAIVSTQLLSPFILLLSHGPPITKL